MTAIRIIEHTNLAQQDGLVLAVGDLKVSCYFNSTLIQEVELSNSISSRIGAIETLFFVLKLIDQRNDIECVEVETTKAFFVASYLKRNFGFSYYLRAIDKLPAHLWNMVFNASGVDDCGDLLSNAFLPKDFSFDNANQSIDLPAASDGYDVTIVAYYAAPFFAVGTKRPEFINGYFNKIDGVNSTIVTAIPSAAGEHVYVPDYGYDAYNRCDDENVSDLLTDGISVIGASWSKQLRTYFDGVYEQNGRISDCVIFTGNPFYYFDVAEYLKNTYQIKIVLDYRDPFAKNPLMLRTPKALQIQTDLEASYNLCADHIVAVNKYCSDLVVGENVRQKVVVIENGYDEALYTGLAERLENSDKDFLTFVYAGSFSKFRNGDNFAAALNNSRHSMVYMGADPSYGVDDIKIERLGMVSSSEAAENIAKCNVGVVFATGEPFESTTKIYDYIGADLPILIVTNGVPRTGALHEITKNLEQIFWVENKRVELEKFLNKSKLPSIVRENKETFSRSYQTQMLFERIYDGREHND